MAQWFLGMNPAGTETVFSNSEDPNFKPVIGASIPESIAAPDSEGGHTVIGVFNKGSHTLTELSRFCDHFGGLRLLDDVFSVMEECREMTKNLPPQPTKT